MPETLRVTAALASRGPAAAFVLTDAQVTALGGGRRAFPVRVRVNGVTLELRVARTGGENLIGLARAVRERADVEIGQAYDLEVTLDDQERTVEVPQDLEAALAADPAAEAAFAALALSHRKEYVRWVSEAKQEGTRADRIAKTLARVRAGRLR